MRDKVTIIDFRREQRKREFKERMKSHINNAGRWIVDNKELVIFFTPIIIGASTKTIRMVGRHINNRKLEDLKNLYCYDRSLGHYWRLRRELSNREWVEIDSRKRSGERLADILSEMRVLK